MPRNATFENDLKTTRLFILCLLFLLCGIGLRAQPRALQGQVRNVAGKPIPYTLIQEIKGGQPVYADSLGNFSLQANSQKHTIKAIAPGHIPKTIVLPFNYKEKLLIYLDPINGNTDFNAYEVVRQARFKRDENESQYSSFKAEVLKTSKAEIKRVPFSIWPISGRILPSKRDTGLVFFSEQVSQQRFYNEHHFMDSVKHYQAAGTIVMPDFTYLVDKDFSFYHNKISMPELGYQGYFTPLSDKALHHYDLKAIGSYLDGNRKVYRIGFKPKKYGTPAFQGYFDIYDSLFTIAYCNFSFKASSHLEGMDSVRVEQLFYYDGDVYHKAYQTMDFHLTVNGFRGFYSSSVYYKNQRYLENPTWGKNKEVVHMDSSSISDNNSYWRQQRIKALSQNERSLLKTENLSNVFKGRYSREPYLQKPFKPVKLLYDKYIYRTDGYFFHFNPLYRSLGYNTVEGVYIRYDVPIWLYNKGTELMLNPEVRFGFADTDFKSRLTAEFTYDLSNPKKVRVEVGHVVDQFNEEDPISPFINTIYSLLFSKNYLKMYGKDFIQIGYQHEITNGFEMQSSLEYASRFPLYNNSTFVITGTPKGFTQNNPEHTEEINNNGFDDHQALTFRAQLAYQFNQRYKMINGKKINLRMTTPRAYINYRQGLPSAISQTKYNFLAAGMSFNTPLGNAGYTKWDISGGGFFNVENIEFIDYKHFNGTQTFYLQPSTYYYQSIKQFSTLGYYDMSTKRAFAEAHFEHHFNGFLLSKIGLLRRTQAHTYFGMNYLHNFTERQFAEFFLGFDNIHNIMRMEFAAGLDNFSKLQPTFLVGIEFDILYYYNNRKK